MSLDSLPPATLTIEGKPFSLPVIVGTEGEKALDIRKLRGDTNGYITYDDGYGNTGSCLSAITFIDGEAGILRHRGYPIEQLAAKSDFLSVGQLVINGELPNAAEKAAFHERITRYAGAPEGFHNFFSAFPKDSHPMAILSAMLNSLGCYYPHMASNNRQQDIEHFDDASAILISKVRTVAAMAYRQKHGLGPIEPRPELGYAANFLHLMFSTKEKPFVITPAAERALDLFLLLHADHEQNCSTSTVRMVASGGANLFASVSAGVCALWGPLHGGANMEVIQMLEQIKASGDDGSVFIEQAKTGKHRLMGFGHRVYKNFDPRAKILGKAAVEVLDGLGQKDASLDIARKLADAALHDDYFKKRNLYPNVDFYSGIILKALGIPVDFFTVMFAIGRMPGWIANWREIALGEKGKIHRPRQIYIGAALRDVP